MERKRNGININIPQKEYEEMLESLKPDKNSKDKDWDKIFSDYMDSIANKERRKNNNEM